MALMNCTECKSNISDKAAHCVHCGAPTQKQHQATQAPAKPLNVVGILLLVIGLPLAGVSAYGLVEVLGIMNSPSFNGGALGLLETKLMQDRFFQETALALAGIALSVFGLFLVKGNKSEVREVPEASASRSSKYQGSPIGTFVMVAVLVVALVYVFTI